MRLTSASERALLLLMRQLEEDLQLLLYQQGLGSHAATERA